MHVNRLDGIDSAHPAEAVPEVERYDGDILVRIRRAHENQLHELQLPSVVGCPAMSRMEESDTVSSFLLESTRTRLTTIQSTIESLLSARGVWKKSFFFICRQSSLHLLEHGVCRLRLCAPFISPEVQHRDFPLVTSPRLTLPSRPGPLYAIMIKRQQICTSKGKYACLLVCS